MSKKHTEHNIYIKQENIIELATDSHAHITMAENVEKIINSMQQDGLETIVNMVSSNVELQPALQLCNKYDNIFFMYGLHPYDAEKFDDEFCKTIKDLAKSNEKFVGVGEIGLDYHVEEPTHSVQQKTFIDQLKLAHEINMPVSIHIRDAHADAIKILEEHKLLLNNSGIIHCFTGTEEEAKKYLNLGFYISISGTITYKKKNEEKTELERAVEVIPLNKLLIETDSPYLCPSPYRGRINEPKYVLVTAQAVADIKQTDVNNLIKLTKLNLQNLLKIKKVK